MKRCVNLLIIIFLTAGNAFGWGANGHRVVGLVAEKHLSAKARKNIDRILAGNSLAKVSTWMDDIRSDSAYSHTRSWHHVNIPDNKTYDQVVKRPEGDIIGKIEEFARALKDKGLSPGLQQEYLKYLVHLVGDLHQPLHVGLEKDRGGNSVRVEWFGKPSNLHKVWDSDMIESRELSFTELAGFLGEPDTELVKQWQSTSVREWAAESMSLRSQIYTLPKDGKLGYKYLYDNFETVELRLLQAGVRLAGLLNEIFG